MHESVTNGIGTSRIVDEPVPFRDGVLGADQGGLDVVPVFHDFEYVTFAGVGERAHSPVVEDQQLYPREPFELLAVRAVGPADAEVVQKPGKKLRDVKN
jgi:hypothetical protein